MEFIYRDNGGKETVFMREVGETSSEDDTIITEEQFTALMLSMKKRASRKRNKESRNKKKREALARNPQELLIRISRAMITSRGKPFATSLDISDFFGIPHNDLLKKIRTSSKYDEYISLGKISLRDRDNRGKKYPYFVLDERAFIFFLAKVNTVEADTVFDSFIGAYQDLLIRYVTAKAVIKANKANEYLIPVRKDSIELRKEFCKVIIEELCPYAVAVRGEEYKNDRCPFIPQYTKEYYKLLGLEMPPKNLNARDMYKGTELQAIMEQEQGIIDRIRDVIDSFEDYHVIFREIRRGDFKLKYVEVA